MELSTPPLMATTILSFLFKDIFFTTEAQRAQSKQIGMLELWNNGTMGLGISFFLSIIPMFQYSIFPVFSPLRSLRFMLLGFYAFDKAGEMARSLSMIGGTTSST